MPDCLKRILCLLLLCSAIHSEAQLSADFTTDKTGGCSPLTIRFTNLSSGSNLTYAWDFGNGNMSDVKDPSAIFIEEKTYTVKLTVTNGTQTTTRTKTITVYKKPTADFSVAKPKVCMPDAVQFTSTSAAGDGSLSSYNWNFGDGINQQGFGSTMNHYYPAPQIPAVTLTVTNSFGCYATVTKTNFVEILPKIDPQFTVNKTLLCSLDDSIKLTNNSTGPGTLSYQWNFGDGTNSALKNPVHQFSRKGVFPVSLTVSNDVGCSATSSPTSVNAAYFNTSFTNTALCRELSFNQSSYLFPSASFWQFGDGRTSNSNFGVKNVYASAGNYNVTLINTYSSCKDTVTKAVNVQDLVSYNSALNVPASACINNSISVQLTSTTPPSSIQWDLGNGTVYNTTSTSLSYYYSTPGTYTIKATCTFGTCTETVSKTITINGLPSASGFVADFGGVCGSPVTVTFKDTSADAVSWQWVLDYNSNTFSTQKNAPYTFNSNGYYSVGLTVRNAAGCSKTISRGITILAPSASIVTTYSSSARGYYDCDSLTLRFAANGNQPIQSYSWNFGNGATSTLPTPQITYNQPGIYTITLNYVTESGCRGTAAYQARVYDKPQAQFNYTVPCGNALDLRFSDASFFSDRWEWSYGDGGSDFYSTPIHTFRDTGFYNVRFINHIGHCADTITKLVHAHMLPSSLNITRADNTCNGTRGTVTFDQRSVRASGGTWDFGDGTTIAYDSSAHNITHTYTATGTYTVRLTSYYNGCTLISTRTVNVLLKQTPVLTTNVSQLCASNSLNAQINNLVVNPFTGNFTYSQYGLSGFLYSDGRPFTGYVSNSGFQNTAYTGTLQNFTAGTTGIRAVVAVYGTSCFDTSNIVTLLVNGPVAGFKLINNNSCYKTQFVFEDTSHSSTSTALTQWRWDMGDGTTYNYTASTTIQHKYASPGNYTVRLTVTDATGCSGVFTRTVNARGPKAAFTPSGLFLPNVPLNTTVNFYNYTTANTTGTVLYTWHYGNGVTSNNYSGVHTYTQPGVYTVMLVANDTASACVDTARYTITVKDFNTAFTFSTTLMGNASCPPVLVRINNLSVGFTSLLWNFGDGTTSTQIYPSHVYTKPGTYRITLTTAGYNNTTGTYIDSVTVKVPSASITADILKGCIQQQVNLAATVSDAKSYLWDFGNGITSNAQTAISHSYLSPGIYNPRLIATDANNCQIATALKDTVVIDSLSIAIKGIPALVCDSALIQFTPDVFSFAQARLGTPLQYKWDFGTGNTADTSNAKNTAFRYTQPGTYTVRFTVVSPYGCSKTATATVVVQQKAKGKITGLPEICETGSVLFTGSATPATNTQWSWDFGNTNTAVIQNPSAQTYVKAGTYIVRLIVARNGCLDTVQHTLTVHPTPVVNAAPRQKLLCLGDSVALSASGGGTYTWSPAAGLSNASLANPSASPRTNTLYTVQVVSNKGCTNKDSIRIDVAQPIQVQLPSSGDLCAGSSLQLTASGATSYQWIGTTTGLSNTSIPNPTAAPSSSITYTVIGSDAVGCFKDTAAIQVTVRALPNVAAGPDMDIVGGQPYQLKPVASSDVTSWTWTPADWLSCTNCPSPVATPLMQTAYVVTVKNTWGCAHSDTVILKLRCAIDNIQIPNTFTPNNDGKNDVFYIMGSGANVVKYMRIYNREGQVVFERKNFGVNDRTAGWNGKYKGEEVTSGTYVYLAQLECVSGELFTLKGTVTLVR